MNVNRAAFWLAVLILLVGAFMRLSVLYTLPPGLNDAEITTLRLAETARQGRVEVFYDLGASQGGLEGLFAQMQAAVTSFIGFGLFTVRMLPLFFGMIALAAVYALGRTLYGPPAGLGAMALMAVSMLPIVLSRTTVAQSATPAYVALVLLLLARAFPIHGKPLQHEPGTLTFASLGVLLGLGFYLTPAAFSVVLVAVIFIAYMVLTRQPLTRRMFSYTWFALVLLIVVATPYLIASLQNPDLSGARRAFDGGAVNLTNIVRGIGGLFFEGDANPAWNYPGRPMFDLVSGIFLVIGVTVAVRGFRKPRFALALLALVLLLPQAVLRYDSPNFLYFAPLLPVLVLFVGLGVVTFYRGMRTDPARIVVIGGLALLAVFNVVWTSRDLFERWPLIPEMQTAYHARVGTLARYLDHTAPRLPSVVCSSDLHPDSMQLADWQLLAMMMHVQNAPLRLVDCGTGLIFADGGARQQVIFLQADGLANANPFVRSWLDYGQVIDSPDLPPDSVLTMEVTDTLADTIGVFTTSAPVAFPPESPGGWQVTAPPVRFGGNLSFLGYVQTFGSTYRPGDLLFVPEYWRVDGAVPPALALFTHLQADMGARPVAQNDSVSVRPETLLPRDVFLQVTYIQLPWTLPDGEYFMSIGGYDSATGDRLPVYDRLFVRSSRLVIGQVAVRGEG
ncbi:MAG TPA: glycosyltransferase family 39 protein [Candidatus Limnocylindrales bacterium]|nr:glycosyltransferase family 39 protein [Candidatus Limnocylindrales bacterium]